MKSTKALNDSVPSRHIQVYLSHFEVGLSIDDFEYLIDAALAHHDQFFIDLLVKFDEIKELQERDSANG